MQETIFQAFHWYTSGGQLWKQLQKKASELKELGFTMVWLPPAFKAASGNTSTGYDPYDLYDLGEFEQKGSVATKYGTFREYLECIQSLKKAGLKVIVDVVMNHKAGADGTEKISVVEVNPENRNKIIGKPQTTTAYTKFSFPTRKGKYSRFKWDYKCFTGIDRIADETSSGIYRILNGYEKKGLWQKLVGSERGNFDYLMFNDIEFRNPKVTNEMKKWGRWYYDQIHFGGVRVDAAKHMPPSFVLDWLQDIRRYSGRSLFSVAEYWDSGNLKNLLDYIEATNHQTFLFDVPLQANFHRASAAGGNFELRNILKNSLVSECPDLAVTFVSNHDTQPLQALESVVNPNFKVIAYALILLRKEGLPVVFYPDLYGARYRDNNTNGDPTGVQLKKINGIGKLLYLRAWYAHGTQTDYFTGTNCIGFVRAGDAEHKGCAVVISNAADGILKMETGNRYADTVFSDYLENVPEKIKTDHKGTALFKCKDRSVSVWIPEK